MGIRASAADIERLEAMGAVVGPAVRFPDTSSDAAIDWGIGTGEWTIRIPDWMPTPINKLYDHHWATRRKHKASDAGIVAHYGRGVPRAKEKRSVSLHVIFPPKKRMPDVDAFAKSLLDSLVSCGILKNDSSVWCQLEPVSYSRGDRLMSFVTIRSQP